MKYKYNADLEIQHISLGDRLACYWTHDGTGMMLVAEENRGVDTYAIADFCQGYCTNAQEVEDYERAWDMFMENLGEIRRIRDAVIENEQKIKDWRLWDYE